MLASIGKQPTIAFLLRLETTRQSSSELSPYYLPGTILKRIPETAVPCKLS